MKISFSAGSNFTSWKCISIFLLLEWRGLHHSRLASPPFVKTTATAGGCHWICNAQISVMLQPPKEQCGWQVLGGWSSLQLLQPKLPAALYPVPADKQQRSLQLRFSDRGAQYLDEGVQRGPAGLLHSHYEIHWHCSIAYLVV